MFSIERQTDRQTGAKPDDIALHSITLFLFLNHYLYLAFVSILIETLDHKMKERFRTEEDEHQVPMSIKYFGSARAYRYSDSAIERGLFTREDFEKYGKRDTIPEPAIYKARSRLHIWILGE